MDKLIKRFAFVFTLLVMIQSVIIFGDETENVKDYVDYISSGELTSLQAEIDDIKDNYGHEAVIVITDNTDGKSSMDYADDFFDYGGYGVGSDYTGILLLINMDDREIWISTSGDSIDVFTDSRIDNMLDNIYDELTDSDFYGGCAVFLSDTEYYINQGVPSGQYREDEEGNRTYYEDNISLSQRLVNNLKNPYIYLGAFIITIAAIAIITLSSKGRVTVNNRTYENANGFKLTNRVDQYIRQTTTRRKIETKSSGGGRSSTHMGGSGRSHGGGGRGF